MTPFNLSADDIDHDNRTGHIELDTTTANCLVRGRGGKIATVYETLWKGPMRLP